jgi:hypothetical protein
LQGGGQVLVGLHGTPRCPIVRDNGRLPSRQFVRLGAGSVGEATVRAHRQIACAQCVRVWRFGPRLGRQIRAGSSFAGDIDRTRRCPDWLGPPEVGRCCSSRDAKCSIIGPWTLGRESCFVGGDRRFVIESTSAHRSAKRGSHLRDATGCRRRANRAGVECAGRPRRSDVYEGRLHERCTRNVQ